MTDDMRDPVWQTLREKIALEKENDELKKALRIAVEKYGYVGACSSCAHCSAEEDVLCIKKDGCEYKSKHKKDGSCESL